MIVNDKQIELCKNLYEKLKVEFPEIEFIGIAESVDNPYNLRVKIIYPENEDREIAMLEQASKISTNILLDYGYHIMILSGTKAEKPRLFNPFIKITESGVTL